MRLFFIFVPFFFLLSLSFSLAVSSCSDGIDNDGDGVIDSADRGCLDSTDASEIAFGYQLQFAPSVNSPCLAYLEEKGYATACLKDHLSRFSWDIAYASPSSFSSCLTQYSSDYYSLQYSESVHYSRFALADCVYQHYTDSGVAQIAFAHVHDPPQDLGESCLKVFYDTYSPLCAGNISTKSSFNHTNTSSLLSPAQKPAGSPSSFSMHPNSSSPQNSTLSLMKSSSQGYSSSAKLLPLQKVRSSFLSSAPGFPLQKNLFMQFWNFLFHGQ